MSDLSNFISNLYDELDQPDDYSIARLSGWFLDASNLGRLNNLIGTDYLPTGLTDPNTNAVTGYSITPEIGNNELGIYKLLFDYNYYVQLARNTALAATNAAGDWVSLAEGDSKISRINKNEVAKNLRAISRDSKDALDKAVKMYLKYGAIPQQIAGDDTVGVTNYVIVEYNRNYYRGVV